MDSQGRNVIVCDNGTGVSIFIENSQFHIWVGQFTDNMKIASIYF